MEEKISFEGKVTTWREVELNPSTLIGRNWVYTTINTFAHKPLHLSVKLRYALDSFKTLYGVRPNIDPRTLEKEIRELLYFGLYPEGGNTVTLHLIATQNGDAQRLILHEATTPYDGYGLHTVRPRSIITNYDIPFEKHQTNVSLTSARFADTYALSHGYEVALRANRNGVLTTSGDNPLFALRGETLLMTPADKGARHSAEREAMVRLAELSGVKVVEEELRVEDVESYEELMVFTPVGLQSIYSIGNIRLGNIYATLLAKSLATLSREGFAL
ncbi:MAG: hypothetical protein J6U53_03865 [Tidjanibacter sp.]|nr:hypothetical protein [Tidjanibacter sp.]